MAPILFLRKRAPAFVMRGLRCFSSDNDSSGPSSPPLPAEDVLAQAADLPDKSLTPVVSIADAASTPTNLTTQRTVYISSAARSAMQSGQLHEGAWRIDFDVQSRWENPLMGWTSSRDPMQGVVLKFPTQEAAVHFAQRQGWRWQVIQPQKASWKQKSYADNFVYSPDSLKFIRTK